MRLDRAPTRRDEAGQMDVHRLARQAPLLVLCRQPSLPCYPRPAATRRTTALPCWPLLGRLLCWALPFAQDRGCPGSARCLHVDAGVELASSSSWKGLSAISRLGGCPWSRAQLFALSRRAPRLEAEDSETSLDFRLGLLLPGTCHYSHRHLPTSPFKVARFRRSRPLAACDAELWPLRCRPSVTLDTHTSAT